jgi:hypothetical protein
VYELKQEPASGDPLVRQAAEGRRDVGRRRRILCAACRHPVTSGAERIDVNGRHDHYVVNQHGYDFRLGCFAHAPGAVGAGPATDEWTWFPGFTWQLAHCRGCARHIGWLYRAPSQIFHGLVLTRLTEEEDPPD